MTARLAFDVSATSLGTRTIADVDVLADGRIVVLDFEIRRVGVFSAAGSFESLLPLPPDLSIEDTLPTRIVALPDGGVVVADDAGRRFFFYDAALHLASIVPFGIETVSLNGFVRHPSGDLYIVAFCAEKNRILHRFDARGRYVDSYVSALEGSLHEKSYSSGFLAVDPDDETLWLSRLTPYEILHLRRDGTVLGRIVRDLSGFSAPRAKQVTDGLIRLPQGIANSAGISLVGSVVVHSYTLADRTRHADAFTKDGTLLYEGLDSDHPLVFAKRTWQGLIVRYSNRDGARVEIGSLDP